jgi:hypothetical protein
MCGVVRSFCVVTAVRCCVLCVRESDERAAVHQHKCESNRSAVDPMKVASRRTEFLIALNERIVLIVTW